MRQRRIDGVRPHHGSGQRAWWLPIASVALVVAGAAGLFTILGDDRSGTGASAGQAEAPESPASSQAPLQRSGLELVDLDSLMVDLMPSGDHTRMMWEAREVVISGCMAEQGYDWVARPSGPSSEEWERWQAWYDSLVAREPGLARALLGSENDSGVLESGCQLAAYFALHREGVPAEARAADLYNEAAGVALSVDAADANVNERVSAALTEWRTENSDRIAALQRDVATELATARGVLGDA